MFGSGDGFIRCSDGHVRWGRFGAAGVLFVVDGDDVAARDAPAALRLRPRGRHVVVLGWRAGPSASRRSTARCARRARRSACRRARCACSASTSSTGRRLDVHDRRHRPGDALRRVAELRDGRGRMGARGSGHERPLHPGFAHAWPHLREIVEAAAGASTPDIYDRECTRNGDTDRRSGCTNERSAPSPCRFVRCARSRRDRRRRRTCRVCGLPSWSRHSHWRPTSGWANHKATSCARP